MESFSGSVHGKSFLSCKFFFIGLNYHVIESRICTNHCNIRLPQGSKSNPSRFWCTLPLNNRKLMWPTVWAHAKCSYLTLGANKHGAGVAQLSHRTHFENVAVRFGRWDEAPSVKYDAANTNSCPNSQANAFVTSLRNYGWCRIELETILHCLLPTFIH